jgi:hypothetical protein
MKFTKNAHFIVQICDEMRNTGLKASNIFNKKGYD